MKFSPTVFAMVAAVGLQVTTVAADEPEIKALGDERFRIGNIVIDKNDNSFRVPGQIVNVDETLEYIAVSKGGIKNYESLLELEASATEFNLACILIGLDDAEAVKPSYHFHERDVDGMPVTITIAWEDADGPQEIPAQNAIRDGDTVFDDAGWVFIGSFVDESNNFMAQVDGTLIGFVHDPVAIIEHSRGVGIGNYGLVKGNADALPAKGSRVEIRVSSGSREGAPDPDH